MFSVSRKLLSKNLVSKVLKLDLEPVLILGRHLTIPAPPLDQKKFGEAGNFKLEKAVIVRKVTRYEYEKYILKPDLTEDQLKIYINKKGSNYDFLYLRHQEYIKSLLDLENAFEKRGIKYRLVQRYNFRPQLIDWADAIFTCGGDGTFLLAASKIQVPNKPVIGINSDPIRSEGFLCLPRKYSSNIMLTLDKIFKGEFMWFWRQRIRLTLFGSHDPPFDLYDHQILQPENRFFEPRITKSSSSSSPSSSSSSSLLPSSSPPGDGEGSTVEGRVLPILSLNEVFIGEKLSARVSFYELSIDGSPREKQKSSGIMVCPGTGSTSWYFNSNNITETTVKEILRIAQKYHCCSDTNLTDTTNIHKIVEEFNGALVFNPTDLKMAYSVRDPLTSGIFHVSSEPRGFCINLKVKSRMWDACVVIDGSLSYSFNDGAELDLSLYPEDALQCIRILPGTNEQ